jgi:hypothetical protein
VQNHEYVVTHVVIAIVSGQATSWTAFQGEAQS